MYNIVCVRCTTNLLQLAGSSGRSSGLRELVQVERIVLRLLLLSGQRMVLMVLTDHGGRKRRRSRRRHRRRPVVLVVVTVDDCRCGSWGRRRLLQERGWRPAVKRGPAVVHAGHDNGGGGLRRRRRQWLRCHGKRPVIRRRLTTAAAAAVATAAVAVVVAATVVRFYLERSGIQVRRLHGRRSFVMAMMMVVRRRRSMGMAVVKLVLLRLLLFMIPYRFGFLHDNTVDVVLRRRRRCRRRRWRRWRLLGLSYGHRSDTAAGLLEFRIIPDGQVRGLQSSTAGSGHFGFWPLQRLKPAERKGERIR